jgi:hypothetical protein
VHEQALVDTEGLANSTAAQDAAQRRTYVLNDIKEVREHRKRHSSKAKVEVSPSAPTSMGC